MTVKKILKLLDPKSQNLPSFKLGGSFTQASLVYFPVVQGEENQLKKQFRELRNLKFSGKKDELTEVIKTNRVLRFIGLGKRNQVTPRTVRRWFGKTYLQALASKPKQIAFICPPEWLTFAAIGVHVAALDPGMFKKEWQKSPAPSVTFVHPHYKKTDGFRRACRVGESIAEGKNLVRILGTLPPNVLNQRTYAELCMALGKKWRIRCKRVPQKELERYELLQAVSRGSGRPSELILFELQPDAGPTEKASAFIGKGLCYDSGGLIGKQDRMKGTKEDMAGSAILLGALHAMLKNGWDVKETTYFMLPIAENMMGCEAMRADDVFTAGDGQKVEVTHTDAEGRLVLADAICYAKNNFKNIHRYMTIATLTGSCMKALGDVYTGLISNNADWSREIVETGQNVGDFLHAAPWDLEYDDFSSCPVADVPNLGENAQEGGWIKGGLFLHHFIPKNKDGEPTATYAHLDIAGSIDMFEKGKPWRRKGLNSGVGVHLLAKLLSEANPKFSDRTEEIHQ